MMVDLAALREELKRDEGIRLKPYKDTVGTTTIGVGRNLDDVGISEYEADILLQADIQRAFGSLNASLPWWITLDADKQRALLNMTFNMGITRLLGFKNALAALKAGDYAKAADEFLDSLWAKQVGQRAQRLANLIRGTT